MNQLLAYADDVNPLGDNIDTIKAQVTLSYASKKIGLEIRAERTKCTCLSST
jgi:hypothetical protein